MWTYLSGLVTAALDWIGKALASLFGPLLSLVGGLVYFLAAAVDVIIKAVQVLLYLVQVLVAFGGGLIRSFVSLAAWDPATITPETNPYSQGTALVLGQFSDLGGDTIAGVLSWAVWFSLAVSVVWLFNRQRSA